MSSITVISNRREVEKATEKAMQKAARMIGGTVAGHASEAAPVDTGLLKNSITFAIGGEPPEITDYQSDNPDKNGEYTEGHYEGTAPEDDEHQLTVYVGTNVEYAPYQELGAPGANIDPRPYLRPAFENFTTEIEQILEKCFKEIN